ncbi:hypothetical protein [Nocardia sp. CDC153]|uniref:hypothetical protein n=1 Tax=Nocardia sp. CDC153 TaxID=3112167 RepID=UPI002DB88D35|nr:hypothetical protein [Nocardia sp. CDC153]
MTPETAHLVPGPGGGTWVLSWLPGWDLTQDQAIDGMALDEILSDPEPEDREWALEMAALRARSLGMELEDVVVRLCARVIERDRRRHREEELERQRQEGTDRPPNEFGGRSYAGKTVARLFWEVWQARAISFLRRGR